MLGDERLCLGSWGSEHGDEVRTGRQTGFFPGFGGKFADADAVQRSVWFGAQLALGKALATGEPGKETKSQVQ
jgi:hypothetical protein